MVLTKTDTDLPEQDTSLWKVVPNPDRPNILSNCKTSCPMTYAVQHQDGGIIRFYQGRTMTKEQAMKLKHELTQQEN